ncbi:DUF1501 domain-containing protein [bacterium]|nr:DUF1501 domain-containing protein [bacterium]
MNLNRRQLLKYGILGAGSTFFPLTPVFSQVNDDHFLYILFLDGAADFTYMFDARPLEMTKFKLLANRTGAEPELWTGTNGQSCWASSLSAPLKSLKNDFTIVNGVFMDKTFAGHTNMIDLILSGNPLGGDSFVPWINSKNQALPKTSLDGIKKNSQSFYGNRLHSTLIEIEGKDSLELMTQLKKESQLAKFPDAITYATERMLQGSLQNTSGQWSQGSKNLWAQMPSAQSFAQQLSLLDTSSLSTDADLSFLSLFGKMAQQKMMRVGIENTIFNNDPNLNFFYDTHSINSTADHLSLYTRTHEKIAKTLQFFKSTAYDNQRSLLDVTTLMIASEFGRTMRQNFVPFDTCGTDHNILSNSFLFAGKGIKSGQVIGATDFQKPQERLSKTHLLLDKDRVCMMARPFDFSTERPLDVKPEVFDQEQYLNCGSIINTLFELFSMPKDIYRRKNSGSPIYPTLKTLLK